MRTLARFARAASAASLLPLFWAAPADAAVVSIPASRDNSMMEDAPGNSCAIGNLYSGETRFALSRRALIAFDVASQIPAGSTINSAVLQTALLRVGALAAPSDVYTLHRLLADWGESSGIGASECFGGLGFPAAAGDATWSHRFWPSTPWSSAGGDYLATPSASAALPIAGAAVWPSQSGTIADVQSWLDSPSGNFGWIIIGAEDLGTTAREFSSRDGDPPPELVVDFTAPALSPPAVPDGQFGQPLRVAKLAANGSDLEVSWDATHCTSNPGHNIVYGTRSTFPASIGGTYGLQGSVCGVGASSPYNWLGSPDPASLDPGSRLMWILVIAHDTDTTEGGWGRTRPPLEREGPGTNGNSAVCGIQNKNVANSCGQEF